MFSPPTSFQGTESQQDLAVELHMKGSRQVGGTWHPWELLQQRCTHVDDDQALTSPVIAACPSPAVMLITFFVRCAEESLGFHLVPCSSSRRGCLPEALVVSRTTATQVCSLQSGPFTTPGQPGISKSHPTDYFFTLSSWLWATSSLSVCVYSRDHLPWFIYTARPCTQGICNTSCTVFLFSWLFENTKQTKKKVCAKFGNRSQEIT